MPACTLPLCCVPGAEFGGQPSLLLQDGIRLAFPGGLAHNWLSSEFMPRHPHSLTVCGAAGFCVSSWQNAPLISVNLRSAMAANDGRLVMRTIVSLVLEGTQTVGERLIACVVERAIHLVQYEQSRLACDRAGNGNPLQEAARESFGGSFSEACIVAPRKTIDVRFQADHARRSASRVDLVGAEQGEIVENGAAHDGILVVDKRHRARLVPYRSREAIDQHVPCSGVK